MWTYLGITSAFLLGMIIFREVNVGRKLVAICGILADRTCILVD